VPEDTVIEQTPLGDHAAAKGSVVSYVVSVVLNSDNSQGNGDKQNGKRGK